MAKVQNVLFIFQSWPELPMHGYDLQHGAPPPHDLGPPPADMAHPDSTDSYVTYLESDDSLHHDAPSP
uniref:Uncharacterized protein n=1 Tax=Timema poppense TaxID=170557 RepID=A0A7R9GXE5_TIMPO|nr:unnamed protein product [Timema poppensis]